jgi:hypothetical protein
MKNEIIAQKIMQALDMPLNPFLDKSLRRLPDVDGRAVRQNFLLDEHPTPQRWEGHEVFILKAMAEKPRRKTLQGNVGHKRYVEGRMDRAVGAPAPETFDPVLNAGAMMPTPQSNNRLVRVEMLDWMFDSPGLPRNHKLSAAKFIAEWADYRSSDSTKGEAARTKLEAFVDEWNENRHQRPMFAAFMRDVKDEAEGDDWPEKLRCRLGLGHLYPAAPSQPIVVAQLRYTVADVVKWLDPKEPAFAFPTVLDGPTNPLFFPAPPGAPYGRAVRLQDDPDGEFLTAETLHRRFDFRLEQIHDIQVVKDPRPALDLKARRNQHLACLRKEARAPDFGWELT